MLPVTMVAKSACMMCNERKKKCDRAYPSCGRCVQLLLKCNYDRTLRPMDLPSCPGPQKQFPFSQCGVTSNEQTLSDGLSRLPLANDSTFLSYLGEIVAYHKQLLNRIIDPFLMSCQKWIPIFDLETLELPSDHQVGIVSRDSMTLLLSMCMIARPLLAHNEKPDVLRQNLYTTVKRLYWHPASLEKPTVPLIKAGLLLSVYEYGHGLSNASFMTISVCASMAQVIQLGDIQYDCPGLPPYGSLRSKDNALKLWWSIKIHERMISLISGLPITPLLIDESEIVNNGQLELEIQYVSPQLAADKHYVAFHLQARAAIWLDLVLDLVRSPAIVTQAGRLRFQAVDRDLLQYLAILFKLGMGSCCEAIAITLNAFVHLHKSRLNINSPFNFPEQDRIESSKAIETMLRVLSDFFEDHLIKTSHIDIINDYSNDSHEAQTGLFTDTYPYFLRMVYVLLLEMSGRCCSQPPFHIYAKEKTSTSPSSRFGREITTLRMILLDSTNRWQIARDYLSSVDGLMTHS